MRTRFVLTTMCVLQITWLCAVWAAGVTSAGSTPLVLAAGALALFAVTALIPGSFWSRLSQTINPGERSTAVLLAGISGGVAAVGVLYSAFQPPLPDEQSAVAAAALLAHEGLPRFFAQYAHVEWLGMHHPPLVPLVFGLSVKLFGGTLFVLRIASLVFVIATVLVTYLLGRDLYDRATGLFAALSLALIPYTLRVGSAARTDMAVTLFGSVALLCALRMADRRGWKPVVGTGLSIGLALLCKYSALLILPVLPLLFLWRRASWEAWTRMVAAFLVAAAVTFPWAVLAYQNGVFEVQARTIVLYLGGAALDEGAVHHHGAVRYQLELLLTSLPSGIGVHNLPLILAGLWTLARRRQISACGHAEPRTSRSEASASASVRDGGGAQSPVLSDAVVLIWIGGIALLLLLVLPDPRYFMLTFPALAVLMARTLRGIERGVEPVVGLGLLYCGQAVYLYTAAVRTAFLFGR